MGKSIHVEGVSLGRDQVIEGKIRSDSQVVFTGNIISWTIRTNSDYVILVLPFGHIEKRIIISLDIEEDLVVEHISDEDHCPVFVSRPPRVEAEETFIVFIGVILKDWHSISQGDSFL